LGGHREAVLWDTPVWLATGMVDSIGIAHNHMHRGGVMNNEAWGKPRDRQRWPGPHGNGLWTQEIYYHLLNCGLRLPPSAGSASGVLPNPVGYNRLYVRVEGELTYEKWFDRFRSGQVFVSNGPLLRCQANRELPGHVFKAAAGEQIPLRIEAMLDSRDPVATVEIIKNGHLERSVPVASLNFRESSATSRSRKAAGSWSGPSPKRQRHFASPPPGRLRRSRINRAPDQQRVRPVLS